MSYQVIARKWRPKTFQDVIGQSHISQTLQNALNKGHLHPALLFTGPRGTGKTSSARIVAKALRCPKAVDFVPCNQCDECELINSGHSVDVMEIDGASNNGVDAVRELRESVGYMPSSGKFKVYIIDEVHMLSTSAFNALLKTLEEPPEHVKFILATTEVHKIPNTVLSRCQRFDFRRIPTKQICNHLANICEREGVVADTQALFALARQGDGSMRDSQSLLDQVITFCQGNVTLEKVVDALGLTDRSLLNGTIESLVRRNSHHAIEAIAKIFQSGHDPNIFVRDLLEEVRNLLMIKISSQKALEFIDLPDTEVTRLQELGSELSEEDIHLLFDMILKGANDLARAQDPQLVLEMLILRMASAPRIESFFVKLGSSQAAPSGPAVKTEGPTTSSTSTPSAQQASTNNKNPVSTANSSTSSETNRIVTAEQSFAISTPVADPALTENAAPASSPSNTPPMNSSQGLTHSTSRDLQPSSTDENSNSTAAQQSSTPKNSPSDSQSPPLKSSLSKSAPAVQTSASPLSGNLDEVWSQLVDRIKQVNSLVAAKLEHSYLKAMSEESVTVSVPANMKFLHEQIADPEFKRKLGNYINTFWGHKYSLKIQLDSASSREKKTENLTPRALESQKREAHSQKVRSEVENHPFIQAAEKIFNAHIQEIKERT